MGVGCAAALMGSLVVISRWFSPARFAQLSSLAFVVGGTGTLLATTPLAWAVQLIGWRGAFLVMAGLTLVFALLLFAVVRDAPPGPAGDAAPESWHEIGRSLELLVRSPELWKVSAIQFVAYASVITVIGLWAVPYLTDVHGLDAVARGNVLLVLNVAVLVGVLAYGWIDRRVASRKWLLVSGAVLSAGLLIALALLPAAGFRLAMVLLVAFTLVGSYVMLNHAYARSILPDHLVGRGLTLENLAVFLGVFVLQSASGLIIGAFQSPGRIAPEAAYRAVFAFLALCLVLAGLVFATAKEEGVVLLSLRAPASSGGPGGARSGRSRAPGSVRPRR
jgi:predicted MFS family arabinose efflux permease